MHFIVHLKTFFYCHSDSTDTSVKGNKNVNIFHKRNYCVTIYT